LTHFFHSFFWRCPNPPEICPLTLYTSLLLTEHREQKLPLSAIPDYAKQFGNSFYPGERDRLLRQEGMYSKQSWESTPREAPQGANWRKFRAYLDGNVKLTQQGRTDLNNTLKTYEQMKKMDAKTQDKYEAEISTLQRQINDLSGQLKIANQTIHEGQDDETPAPVLHMMNRLADVETKHIALRNRCVDAIVENTCYSAIAGLGLDCHEETCPPEQEKTNLEDIMMNICQDVADQNDLCDQDYLNDEVESARESAYDDGHDQGCEYQEEETTNDFTNKLDALFGEGDGSWETRLEAIAEKYKANERRIAQDYQTCVEHMVDKLTLKFSHWREVQCATNPQYSVDDEIHFLLGEDQEGVIAKKVFDDLYPGQYSLTIKDKTYAVPGDDEYDQEE